MTVPIVTPEISRVIPDKLRQRNQWVMWRREERDGKLTKVPYCADGHGRASATDPKTWASYDAAFKAYQSGKYDGIGYVLNDPHTGIDLDHCRDVQTGIIQDWALSIIKALNSYTEITPSGTGVHIIVEAKLPPGGNRTGNIEMYDRGRYFTITGNHLPGTPETIEPRQQELNDIHAQAFQQHETVSKPGGNGSKPVTGSDADILSKAMAAANGPAFARLWLGDISGHENDDSKADFALCCHLAFWTGKDPVRMDSLFRQSKLYREKWERQDYRERTINKAIEVTTETYSLGSVSPRNNKSTSLYCPSATGAASERFKSVSKSVSKEPKTEESVSPERIEEWCKGTSGWFSYEELDRELGIKETKDKDKRRLIIFRMKQEQKLESHPRDNKLMRYVNVAVRVIDFKAATLRSPLAIRYPFGIEKYFKTYPGNIIVIAGAADSGKTALLLNFIKLNMFDFSIFYQSSEMGKDELASRLELFEGLNLEDWNFTAEERSHDFADVIRPDCINIIDFMELSNDFYAVAEYLRAIHDKLASGIALVALQKKTGVDIGRGGEFGLEKPRLYLSLDSGKLKITKAKNWVDPKVNPKGLVVNFKTVAGCKFIVTQDWHKEDG